jgi:hypothetical protein
MGMARLLPVEFITQAGDREIRRNDSIDGQKRGRR